jgi:hypothetical protein
MTLGDIHELLLENGQPVSDNNDFELFTADGLPITGIHRVGNDLYLSDTDNGYTEED